MLIGFFRFQNSISDSFGCGCARTEVIPAACAVCDELFEKLMLLTAAAFALLGYIFAHAKHPVAAMTMTAERLKKSSQKQQRPRTEEWFSHAFPLGAVVQAMPMSALSVGILC